MSEISVAVVTQGHAFHVRPFIDFFNSLNGVKAYVISIGDWLTASGIDDHPWYQETYSELPDFPHREVRDSFDVTLFYNLAYPEKLEGDTKAAVERLIELGKPIFVMHHALFNWDARWGKIIGLSKPRELRDEDYGGPLNGIWFGTFPVNVVKEHPAAKGLIDFEINDETYALPDCDDDCEVLLTTEKRTSMRTIAWTRTEGKSRIFCSELGHDWKAWQNPAFRTLVQNGIHWCAEKELV